MDELAPPLGGPRIEFAADLETDAECRAAFTRGLDVVRATLGDKFDRLLNGWTFSVGSGLTASSGEVLAEERRIVFDSKKGAMSLNAAESEVLVPQGIIEPSDWTSVLPDSADEPWGCLTRDVVHEVGHLILLDVPPHMAPTQYGRQKEGESTPEVFTYLAFGIPQNVESEALVRQAIDEL